MNNKSDYGCGTILLIVVVCIVFFGGNIALFTGGLEDSNNAFLSVVAMLIDIGIFIGIVYAVIKHFEKKSNEKEKAEAERIASEISHFQKRYGDVCEKRVVNRDSLNTLDAKVKTHHEVIACATRFFSENDQFNFEISVLSNSIRKVLNYSDCNCASNAEKLDSLERNKEILENLYSQIQSIKSKRNKNHIVLNERNFDQNKSIDLIRSAFAKLSTSQKIKPSGFVTVDSLLFTPYLFELDFFRANVKPFSIKLAHYFYVIYPHVILVFSADGVFVTALTPDNLVIKVERKTEDVYLTDGKFESDIIGSDSKRIQMGNTRTRWLYERVSGGPDRRYSYNPSTSYRTDVMEYGTVKIQIGNSSVSYDFSSSEAISAFETAASEFKKNLIIKENLVPRLASLLSMAAGNSSSFKAFDVLYSASNGSKTSYCYIERG